MFFFAKDDVFWLQDVAESGKIKVGPKKSDGALELIDRERLAIAKHAQVARSNKQQNAGVCVMSVMASTIACGRPLPIPAQCT